MLVAASKFAGFARILFHSMLSLPNPGASIPEVRSSLPESLRGRQAEQDHGVPRSEARQNGEQKDTFQVPQTRYEAKIRSVPICPINREV